MSNKLPSGTGYPLSDDYDRLFELMEKGYRVICFFENYRREKFAEFSRNKHYPNEYELTTKGICFECIDVSFLKKDEITQTLKAINLKFIDINEDLK